MRYIKRISPKRERNRVRAVAAVSLLLAAAWFVCMLQSASSNDDLMSNKDSLTLLGVEKGLSSPTRVEDAKSFVVAGIDLNQYHYNKETNITTNVQVTTEAPPFELFQDFDISSQLKGDESWETLVYVIRRRMQAPALSFFVDKVAMKRWLPSIGIKTPKSLVLKYKSELTNSGSEMEEKDVIRKLLPLDGTDYCAKPTHTSYSDGVWLVKNEIKADKDSITQYVSTAGHGFEKEPRNNVRETVAASLAKSIHEPARSFESWGLKNVKPGIVVEERYTSFDRDDRPAVEFKVFCIWGRVFVSTFKQGSQTFGAFWRNGSRVKMIKKHPWENDERPSWVDWNGVIELAEKLATNKDMIRVDIYVGRPAQQTGLSREEASIVLSEC